MAAENDKIESSKYYLRRPIESDIEFMLQIEADTEVVKFTPMKQGLPEEKIRERHAKRLADAEKMLPYGHWFAFEKQTNNFVGCFVIFEQRNPHPEIGFMISKKYWGKGVTTEIASALVDYAKTILNVKTICAVTDKVNIGSIRVLEKLGFKWVKYISEDSENEPIELNYFEKLL